MRKLPVFFILLLLFFFIFLLGMRYGNYIEHSNEANKALIRNDKKSPPASPITFREYSHSGCLVSFLLPSSLTMEKESSQGAFFKSGDQFLQFDCKGETTREPSKSPYPIFVLDQQIPAFTKDHVIYAYLDKPLVRKPLSLVVHDTLLKLIESTMKVSSPSAK